MINDPHRRTGRTYNMIKTLVDSIEDGQPMAILIGLNYAMVRQVLLPMLMKQLEERGLVIDKFNKSDMRIEIGESTIRFGSIDDGRWIDKIRGIPPCWFVDHTVLDYGKIDEYSLSYLTSEFYLQSRFCEPI